MSSNGTMSLIDRQRERAELERLADSGYGWAYDALKDSATTLFVTAGGFDRGFDAVVAETAGPEVLERTLADMYSDEAGGRTNIGPPNG